MGGSGFAKDRWALVSQPHGCGGSVEFHVAGFGGGWLCNEWSPMSRFFIQSILHINQKRIFVTFLLRKL